MSIEEECPCHKISKSFVPLDLVYELRHCRYYQGYVQYGGYYYPVPAGYDYTTGTVAQVAATAQALPQNDKDVGGAPTPSMDVNNTTQAKAPPIPSPPVVDDDDMEGTYW